ncbi:MAG TPA: glycoside hydrolase family 16 protein [Acidimicrobiales bacterium]
MSLLLIGLVWGLTATGSGARVRGNDSPDDSATTKADPSTSTSSTEADPRATTVPNVPFALAAPSGYSASELTFQDTFGGTSLNQSNWNTYITSNGSGGAPWNSNGAGGSGVQNPRGITSLDYDLPTQLSVDNGLAIMAQQTPTPGDLHGAPQSFSWRSGVISSYDKFETLGGYVQIEAKVPTGNGLWPAFWMLPGPSGTAGDNFEIDIFEGGFLSGASPPDDVYSWHLETPAGPTGGTTNVGVNVTAGYHVYAIEWVPGQSIRWFFDGRQVGELTRSQAPIPDEPMELIMNLGVASPATGTYRSIPDASTPRSATMLVHEVQVYR